jgi:hypothetical protein
MDMIELLLPCRFDTLKYSWVKVTIGIYTLLDYSVAKKCQQLQCLDDVVEYFILVEEEVEF